MSQSAFPLFRLTVLGAERSGKTCLISSFVNNFCPVAYQTTAWPSLFYKVMRLPPEDDEKGKVQSVVLEIEDTFASGRPERDIRSFFTMRRNPVQVPHGVNDFTPFNIWKPPLIPLGEGQKYYPITIGRMAFLIVFDALNTKSFDEALNTHSQLQEELDAKRERLKPVVFMVATKTDKDPDSETYNSVIAQAEAYSQKAMTRLWKVSALDGKNVKKMFRDMTRLLLANELLWQMEIEEETESEEEKRCVVM